MPTPIESLLVNTCSVSDPKSFPLKEVPVHLGSGARAIPQERFTGEPEWYEHYGERTAAEGAEGRLVSMHTFTEPWDSWEVHPHGEELVVCIDGTITLFQDIEGQIRSATLRSGEAIINPLGVWHTADVEGTATALFITAGMGTENRPR
jgi:mannose-6-phosphate isomerase-like protein (cupin superfamily)